MLQICQFTFTFMPGHASVKGNAKTYPLTGYVTAEKEQAMDQTDIINVIKTRQDNEQNFTANCKSAYPWTGETWSHTT